MYFIWIKLWRNYVGFLDNDPIDEHPPTIDNSILLYNGNLRRKLVEKVDFDIINEKVEKGD